MSTSAAETFISLTKRDGKIGESEVEKVFGDLEPVPPEAMLGEWLGGSLDTGHPGNEKNKELRWAGKAFRSVDDVDPMVVYNDEGKRVWMESIGSARLREVKYRGTVSTAMIYNSHPIIDNFRRVTDDLVAGAMDTPLMKEGGVMYFYLTRLQK